jgi:3',5'-cyclic AMP phosphodiesterase CpdA
VKQKTLIGRITGTVISLAVAFSLLFITAAGAEYATFAVATDSHVGAPDTAYPEFIRAIENEHIGIIIHLGDAINRPGSVSQWKTFFDMTGTGKTLHLAPGNHDIRGEASLAAYRQFFDSPYSSFSDGDTLFILLNTEMPGEESRIAGGQLAWLTSELARPFRYKFVFLHEPLFGVLPLHGLDRHKEERDALHRLFVESGVSLVMAGHDHIYDRKSRDGIIYVVAGRVGGLLPWPSANGNSFRYIVGSRTWESYSFVTKDMEGHVRDRFTVNHPAAINGEVKPTSAGAPAFPLNGVEAPHPAGGEGKKAGEGQPVAAPVAAH